MRPVKLSSLVGLLALSGAAGAQALPKSTDVVVSADRLKDSVANPLEINSDDEIPAAERSLSALTERIPNLQLSTGGAGSFGSLLSYRGSVNTPYFSDPAVTVYLDDLPLTGAFTSPATLVGFGDALFTRGPQGSAFGRAGSAGVLSFLSARPASTAGAELRLGAGDYNERLLTFAAHTAALGGADTRRGDASINASIARRDGYIRNERLQTSVDEKSGGSMSGRVRWRPNDAAQYTVQALLDRDSDGAQPLVPLQGRRYTVDRERDGRTDIRFIGLAAKGEFNTTLGLLSSVTSYTDWRLDPYDNQLRLPPTLDSHITQKQRTWNEELHLASSEGSALQWSLGAWFSDSNTGGEVLRSIPDLFPIESSRFDLTSRSAAIFGELHLVLNDAWLLTTGLRAERIARTFRRLDRLAPGPAVIDEQRTFGSVLPKLTLAYAISPRTRATASVSLGNKPGGWSAYTGNANLAGFKAEKTTAVEVALDSRPLDDAIQLSARAFLYEIKNYQIERSFTETDYLVINASRARSTGLELAGDWRASRRLSINAGVGFTRALLRDFTDVFTQVSHAGNRTPYAPSYDAHLSASWRTSRWSATAEMTSTGKTFFDENETSLFAQAAHTTLNARAVRDFGRVRVAFYGANLTNENYYTLIVPGVLHGVPAAPRTWGVELTVRTAQ